jgi:hypothetical protein
LVADVSFPKENGAKEWRRAHYYTINLAEIPACVDAFQPYDLPQMAQLPNNRSLQMAAVRAGQRRQLWPTVGVDQLWDRRRDKGFASIPRTLPLIMVIADELTTGTPVSSTYLELWSRVFDEGFVKLDKPDEMALAAGFKTQRGRHIWGQRLDLLQQLGFILLAPGAQGQRSFALLFNPYRVIKSLRPRIPTGLYNALVAQANAVGAYDLNEEMITAPAA